MKWWGYLHKNESIQVKPVYYPSIQLDVADASKSPFVIKVFLPFEAKDREDAISIIKNKLLKIN